MMVVKMQDTTILNNQAEREDSISRLAGRQNKKAARRTIFAGDLNLDPIARKRKEAQEKAMKIVGDAWARDQKTDQSIAKRRDHYEEMKAEVVEYNKELSRLQTAEEDLKEEYQIDPESQEQKDLELLKKQKDIEKGLLGKNALTAEDEERLAELGNQPLTEYQRRALDYYDQAGVYQVRKNEAEAKMKDDQADIRSIHQALLDRKRTPMEEAQEAREEIMEAASKDIIGMIREDGMENIDEAQEENEEKAEETAEKQEKEEEHLEEVKEQRAIQEAFIEGTKEAVERAEEVVRRNENKAPELDIDEILEYNSGSNVSADVSKSLDELKFSMNILEADLKGIKVDEEV